MKKIFSAIFAIICVLSFTACNNKETKTEAGSESIQGSWRVVEVNGENTDSGRNYEFYEDNTFLCPEVSENSFRRSGNYSYSGTTLRISYPGHGEDYFECILNGDMMEWSNKETHETGVLKRIK